MNQTSGGLDRLKSTTVPAPGRRMPQLVELLVCDPGKPGRTATSHLDVLEASIKVAGTERNPMYVEVGTTDKGRQKALNDVGGKEGAGEQALNAYWDLYRYALSKARRRLKADYSVDCPMVRVSIGSDEGLMVVAANGFGVRDRMNAFPEYFGHALEQTRATMLERTDRLVSGASETDAFPALIDYAYIVKTARSEIALDLKRFSGVLAYPQMVLSSNNSFSEVFPMTMATEAGRIQKAIKKLENEEVIFLPYLPREIVPPQEYAEVITQFETTLREMFPNGKKLEGGYVVELRFAMPPEMRKKLLRFISDGWGDDFGIEITTGTRKGFVEVYNCELGMRGLNTFFGKAKANYMLSVAAEIMNEYVQEFGTPVCSVDGPLRYWVETNISKEQFEAKLEKITNRVFKRKFASQYPDFALKPKTRIRDATGLDTSEVSEQIALDSMQRTEKTGTFKRTDFLVSFLEIVHRDIQQTLIEKLGLGKGARAEAVEKIAALRQIFINTRLLQFFH